MKKFICTVCGYVHEGDAPPEFCPVCKASSSKFEEMKGEMTWADEHRVGICENIDPEIIEGLRANFTGECTEVGMYIAMSREAEFGACDGKKKLANLAKQNNLDAIHDSVHEMCKDEARHGKAFKGLLDRYFN